MGNKVRIKSDKKIYIEEYMKKRSKLIKQLYEAKNVMKSSRATFLIIYNKGKLYTDVIKILEREVIYI